MTVVRGRDVMPAARHKGPVRPEVFDRAVLVGAPFGRQADVEPFLIVAEHEPLLGLSVVLDGREDPTPFLGLIDGDPGGHGEFPLR